MLFAACAPAVAVAQHTPPVQWFAADRIAQQLASAPAPWQLLLDVPTLSVGRYRLAKGAADRQRPHDRDESNAVLQHDAKAGMQLVLLDPQNVRRRRLDAYDAGKTTGGLVVPLTAGKAEVAADRLDVELSVDRSQRDRGALTIRFGPHELRAALQMQPHH